MSSLEDDTPAAEKFDRDQPARRSGRGQWAVSATKFPVRLVAMLRRRSARTPEVVDADAMAAIARCQSCRMTELCDELVAQPGNGGYRGFCPNSAYVEVLRQNCLRF
jgi:hypothetical protein